MGAPLQPAGRSVGDDGVLGYDQPQTVESQLETVKQLRGVEDAADG